MTTTDIAALCERLRAVKHTREDWHEPYGAIDLPCDADDENAVATPNNPNGPEAADTIERQAAEMERLRGALQNIQIEAEREEGRWVHLKRVIAINARAALTGEDLPQPPNNESPPA